MQFVKNFAAFFLVEGLDGIFHDADAESAAHQAVGGAKDAVFRNHAEHEKIGRRLTSASVGRQRLGTRRLRIDPREDRPGIWIVENIEGVLFQENLLEGAEIRSEEHTSELQSQFHLVCRLLRPPRSPLFPYTTLFRSTQYSVTTPNTRKSGAASLPPRWAGSAWERADCVLIHARTALVFGLSKTSRVFFSRRICWKEPRSDRKSTRLNSSHSSISYAVFCDHRDLHSFPTRRSSDLRSIP